MKLSAHIHYLLFRHDCVTVPGFGSFLVEQKAAHFDPSKELYYPPLKQVSFNEQLQSNDGILAKHIGNTFGLAYETAVLDVHKQMISWKEQLETESLTLEGLGVLALNKEGKLVFTPQQGTNFLAASYALDAVPARRIFRGVSEEAEQPPTYFTLEQPKSRRFVGYAAAIAALITLAVGSERYLDYQADTRWQAAETQRQEVRAQAALTVYDLGKLPTLNIELPAEAPKRSFHIIAGSFRSERNANKLAKRLKLLGYYNAQKLPKTNRGFFQVSFAHFPSKREAYNAMADIKDANYPDVWVLKK